MLMITNNNSGISPKGGFSVISIRFFLLGFLSLILILAPMLGILASILISITFGIFTVAKILEYQNSHHEYHYYHELAMNKIYHYGSNAEYLERRLNNYCKRYEKAKPVQQQVIVKQPISKESKQLHQGLRLAIAK